MFAGLRTAAISRSQPRGPRAHDHPKCATYDGVPLSPPGPARGSPVDVTLTLSHQSPMPVRPPGSDRSPGCTNGPRSLIRTTAERPLHRLTTVTLVPNGSVRCAAVISPVFIVSPLAVCWPLYTEAMPKFSDERPVSRRMVEVFLVEVGRRQELVTHATPSVAPGGCIANPDRVRGLISLCPR
jgi:hypothetical protein